MNEKAISTTFGVTEKKVTSASDYFQYIYLYHSSVSLLVELNSRIISTLLSVMVCRLVFGYVNVNVFIFSSIPVSRLYEMLTGLNVWLPMTASRDDTRKLLS